MQKKFSGYEQTNLFSLNFFLYMFSLIAALMQILQRSSIM